MLQLGEAGKRYKPQIHRRPDYDQVRMLDVAKNQESYADFEAQLFRRVEGIVKRYLDAGEIMDLAHMNDMVLRAMMSIPESLRGNARTLYDKMKRKVREVMTAKRQAIERNPNNWPSREIQERLSNMMAFGDQLMERFETLESSITQLRAIIESRLRVHPDHTFATSIDLDVRFGIDLMEMGVEYHEVDDALFVDIILYQAKVSRTGLTAEDVRNTAQRYEEQSTLISNRAYLDIDLAWFLKEIKKEKSQIKQMDISLDTVVDIVTQKSDARHAGDKLEQVLARMSSNNAYQKFAGHMSLWEQMEKGAKEFEIDNPVKAPRIVLHSVNMQYALDTKSKGLVLLNPKEAKEFGLNSSSK